MPGPTPAQLAKAGTEEAHQIALFCFCSQPEQRAKYPELEWLFHIPNGGARDKITAGKFKAGGVKAGVPDLFLPVARHGKHGLWIELKILTGSVSEHQQKWIDNLCRQDYAVAVAYSWEQASEYLIQYLEAK